MILTTRKGKIFMRQSSKLNVVMDFFFEFTWPFDQSFFYISLHLFYFTDGEKPQTSKVICITH